MLNTPTGFHILPAMKNALLAAIVFACALPLAAQTSQFGFLVGGSRAIHTLPGTQGRSDINDFTFGDSVREVFYATRLDPDTLFKIKAGEVNVPITYRNGTDGAGKTIFAASRGKVDHVDALVDYRFSEAFGSAGIFAGLGMYKLKNPGQEDETNAGASGGINADFPLSRRYGVMVEATYHYLHTDVRQRFVTLTAGLRIAF